MPLPLRDPPLGRAAFANLIAAIMIVMMAVVAILAAEHSRSRSLTDQAVVAAQRWYASSIGQSNKVERLLAGEVLTPDEHRVVTIAGEAGRVRSYTLFNRDGFVVRSTRGTVRLSDPIHLAERDAALRAAQLQDVTVIRPPVGESDATSAHIFIPVTKGDEVIGIVSPVVDQTAEVASSRSAFLGLLTLIVIVTATALGGNVAIAVSLRKKHLDDRRMRHRARHDDLTGVANRAEYTAALDKTLKAREQDQGFAALLMVDLDRFKAINDTLGHASGDLLLLEVARCLISVARRTDLVARPGGDEFAVVVDSVAAPEQATAMADRMADAIRAIRSIGGTPVDVTASIGIAVSEPGITSEEIQRLADAALYCAKESGRNQSVLFRPGMDGTIRRRNWVRNTIRDALRTDSFEVHYQPLHDARSGALRGFEALLRLPDGSGEYIPPEEFIPVTEDIGAATDVGVWVLRHACSTAARWPDHINVSVNVSPLQFRDDMPSAVTMVLNDSGLRPGRLELEITENVFINDPQEVTKQLRAIRALGVRVVMDDFGTGYSSLQYLWQFPFDKLKVDRSCFLALDRSEGAREILRTISAMSEAMNLSVTAEGIETETQRQFAEEAGYTEVQGYLLHRPMPSGDVAAYIEGAGRSGSAASLAAV